MRHINTPKSPRSIFEAVAEPAHTKEQTILTEGAKILSDGVVEGEGLVRYSTGAQLLVQELRSASLPMRDKVIQQDWRGLFFEGSVYTLEEEEERIRREFNINY